MKKTDHINSNDVIFLVMYDISDNYTRRTVVDYLLREGCLRIQRSIFMGNLPFCKMQNIARTLEEIHEGSSSDDSYIIMPGENGAFPPTRDGCIHSLSMRERG